MSEFGNHPGGSGATFDNAFNNVVWAKATSTPASSGTLTTISIRIRSKAGSPTVNCAIYADAAGVPGALIAQGSAVSVGTENWYDVTVSAALTSGTQYWFAWIVPGGGGGTDAEAAEDTNGGLTEVYFQALGAFPATMSGASSQANERYWMYGTYTPAAGPDSPYQPPIAGLGNLGAAQRRAGATARMAQQMLFHLPQDVSFVPPPLVAPFVPELPGQGIAFRESKLDYTNRALYSTVMLWGGGGDIQITQPDTAIQPIAGERALQATQTAFQTRSRVATQLLWPVPNDAPPVNVLSPPYQAPLVGERLWANALRQQAVRAQLATAQLIFTPSDGSTAQSQPDTYQPPVAGVGALQASAKAYSQRATQSNALLWPVPQDPPFVPITVTPMPGEGLWAKSMQRFATQSRLASALLLFAPSDTSGAGSQPITAIQPLVGQGAYAAQQQAYRLGADRANRLLWTTSQDRSVALPQPDTYQPPLVGDGVYRLRATEMRRRAVLAQSLLMAGTRDLFIAPLFNPAWAANVNKAIGLNIEPK